MRPARAARVVDASICVAIYFREPRYREAMRLIQGVDLFAPTLLNYEMASAASRKIDEAPRQRESILAGLSNFLHSDIHRLDVDYLAVVVAVEATGLTLYDASYLYLARLMGLPLLTFDGGAVESCPQSGAGLTFPTTAADRVISPPEFPGG